MGGELRIYGQIVQVSQSEIQTMLSECLEYQSKNNNVTAWEWDFLNRLYEKHENEKPLLSREIDKLHKIWSSYDCNQERKRTV